MRLAAIGAQPNASDMTDGQRTIVIGVDYSDHSIHAVDEALRALASARDVRLLPMLVLPGSPMTGMAEAEEMTRELVARSKDNLLQLLQTRARALGVTLGTLEPRVEFGPPAERIISEARAQDAELIVVGTHGRQGLSHLLLGSVADEVMRKAPCSVLVARARDGAAHAQREARPRAAAAPPKVVERASPAASSADGAIEAQPTIVAGPHIDAGRVVLHVLDSTSGQVFVCAFDDATTLSVEPIEGNWVPAPPSDARARAARIAHDAALRERSQFDELFEEIARRRARELAR